MLLYCLYNFSKISAGFSSEKFTVSKSLFQGVIFIDRLIVPFFMNSSVILNKLLNFYAVFHISFSEEVKENSFIGNCTSGQCRRVLGNKSRN